MDKTAGYILKETRLSKNITLEDASKYTKIHINILKSIEGDDFKALGSMYTKSFLRLYADYLGLDKDDIIRRYLALSGEAIAPKKPKMVATPKDDVGSSGHEPIADLVLRAIRKLNFKVVIIILLSVVALFGFVKFMKTHKFKPVAVVKNETKRNVIKKEASPVKPLIIKKVLAPAIVEESLKAVEVKKNIVVPQAATITKTKLQQEKLVLVVRAKDKCWMQVTVDSQIVFATTLKKMTSDTWTANEKIELWLGNAGAVELEFNGKFLGKIGRSGQVLKHVVLTRSGLSIKS